MGTWGSGLFDGDGPLDVIGDLVGEVEADVTKLAADAAPSTESVGRLSGDLGLLLQLSPFSFESEENAGEISSAIERHRALLSELPAEAGALLGRVVAGSGKQLADRKGDRPKELTAILGGYLNHVREPALFEHPGATAVVQRFAEACGAAIEEVLGQEDLDLYELGDLGGPLGLLLLVSPYRLERDKIEGWREKLRGVFGRAREEMGDDPDLEFFAELMQKAETAFERLLAGAGAAAAKSRPARRTAPAKLVKKPAKKAPAKKAPAKKAPTKKVPTKKAPAKKAPAKKKVPARKKPATKKPKKTARR